MRLGQITKGNGKRTATVARTGEGQLKRAVSDLAHHSARIVCSNKNCSVRYALLLFVAAEEFGQFIDEIFRLGFADIAMRPAPKSFSS